MDPNSNRSAGHAEPCELCEHDGGSVLFRSATLRIVRVLDGRYPAYLRVIVGEHVREMTDLPAATQRDVLRAVLASERLLRRFTEDAKINIASIGNRTPHVHWHIVARHAEDAHFPEAIWGQALRNGKAMALPFEDAALATALAEELAER